MKVQIAVCAQGLSTEASYQASVVWTNGGGDGEDVVLGRTEASAVTTSPVWSKLIHTPEELPSDASLSVHISSADSEESIVATAHFALETVMNSYYSAAASFTTQEEDGGAKIAMHVTNPPRMGKFTLQLAGADLPDTDFGGAGFGLVVKKNQHSDPFYELYSAVTGAKLLRSIVINDDLNPTWPPVELDLDALCGGRLEAPIRITIHDKDKGDTSEYLGQALVSVSNLIASANDPDALKHFPVLKSGKQVAQGSIYAKIAQIDEADVASRQAQRHMQMVLQTLDAQRDQLLEQVSAQETAAAEAQAAAEAVQETVLPLEQTAEALAEAQAEIVTQMETVLSEHAQLVEAANQTPCTGTLVFQLAAKDLPDTDFGIRNKTDPIYQIMTVSSRQVLRSEIVENDLNPVWLQRSLDLTALEGGGGLDQPFTIVISDKDGGDNQTKIGSLETTVNKLIQIAASGEAQPIAPSHGQLFVKKAELEDVVDHAAVAQQFYTDRVEPLKEQFAQAAQAFQEAYAQLEAARAEAATAMELAHAAKDKAQASKLALEMMEQAVA